MRILLVSDTKREYEPHIIGQKLSYHLVLKGSEAGETVKEKDSFTLP